MRVPDTFSFLGCFFHLWVNVFPEVNPSCPPLLFLTDDRKIILLYFFTFPPVERKQASADFLRAGADSSVPLFLFGNWLKKFPFSFFPCRRMIGPVLELFFFLAVVFLALHLS